MRSFRSAARGFAGLMTACDSVYLVRVNWCVRPGNMTQTTTNNNEANQIIIIMVVAMVVAVAIYSIAAEAEGGRGLEVIYRSCR